MKLPSKLVDRWIATTVALSIVARFDGGCIAHYAALEPDRIWRGEVWRLVTWPLVELTPMSLIMTCVALYRFGGDLAYRWGERRLRRFASELVLAAGLATCVLDLVFRHGVVRWGGWAITEALVIAWARQFPTTRLNLYGMITLEGRQIVRLVLATSVVFAIYAGPVYMAPELVACGIAATYSTKRLASL